MSQSKWIGLAFVIFLLMAAAACNLTTPQPTPQSSFPGENPYLDVKRVSVEDARAAFDNGTAIFIDVRSSTAFADSHIPGALSIPASDLKDQLGQLDPGQWIITYCT